MPKSPLQGDEFYFLRDDGSKGDDWLHEEILDNPEADAYFRATVMEVAIREKRMTCEQAEKLYGIRQ